MNLICAACADCLDKYGREPDDQCPVHQGCELRDEVPDVGFTCDHHTIKAKLARDTPPAWAGDISKQRRKRKL